MGNGNIIANTNLIKLKKKFRHWLIQITIQVAVIFSIVCIDELRITKLPVNNFTNLMHYVVYNLVSTHLYSLINRPYDK